MKARAFLIFLVSLVIAGTMIGCASSNITDLNRRLTSIDVVRKKPPNAEYVVDPPDAIRVEFINEPTATREVTLRSDGMVTLPYLEDVEVAGLTPEQIRIKLEEAYSRYYKDPRILVTVTAYNSKHVYVYGEVGRRGSIPYTGEQTVSDVLGQVGGFTNRATWWGNVQVIRRDPENPEVFDISIRALLYEGDVTQEVSLAENDVIYVPPSPLAWIGYRLEELLFPLRGTLSAIGGATSLAATGGGL